MSYYGWPTDVLDALANELSADARMQPIEVGEALTYLSSELMRLSRLYESLCRLANDDCEIHDVIYDYMAVKTMGNTDELC